jgi:xanthine dehydrogenase accessory factor
VAELFACTSNNWIGEFSVSTSIYQQFTDYIRDETPVALATIIEGPGVGAKLLVARVDGVEKVIGSLGHPELDRVVARDTAGELEAGRTGVRHYGPEGQATPEDLIDTPTVVVFIESFSPAPQMWIFGAVDFTAALGRVAKVLGYRVTVCDAREIFATKRRFPMADEVMVTWPTPMFEKRGNTLGPRDAVCILTHDPKFDVPAVQGALSTSVGYIGVMGSRKTHNKRLERLAEVGVNSPEQLSRLMSPIGLDLGGRTPEETAIAICAEIIARRTGHSATSLKNTDGAIHS